MPIAALLLLPALLSLGSPTTPADPVRSLRTWLQRSDRFRGGFDAGRAQELTALIDRVALLRLAEPDRAGECDLAILDVAAHRWEPSQGPPLMREPFAAPVSVSRQGIDRMEQMLDRDAALGSWLGLEILAMPHRHPVERRRVAADLLIDRHIEDTLSVLMASARDEDPLLRDRAVRALVGWEDSAVHRFMLAQLERGEISPTLAGEHLVTARTDLDPQALDGLRGLVAGLYTSPDWRDAARARSLCRALDTTRAAPLLIESLALWTRRLENGVGSRRIQHEILEELRRISGRSIGAFPDRWNLWWKAVQEGRIMPLDGDQAMAISVTSATFFGLRPVTDRVMFVVDRSGSMKAGFGTTGHSRYEEAIDQLVNFASDLGSTGRFGVTLFESGAQRWKPRLVEASEANVKAARRWLSTRKPDGGTQLRTGIGTALDLDRQGRIELERLEADTVIVLCDGGTAQGKGWVSDWLARFNEEARLVFHCVQIGRGGDGTLQALAEGTGGDFVTTGG